MYRMITNHENTTQLKYVVFGLWSLFFFFYKRKNQKLVMSYKNGNHKPKQKQKKHEQMNGFHEEIKEFETNNNNNNRKYSELQEISVDEKESKYDTFVPKINIGIDFGTDGTAIAYSFPGGGNDVYIYEQWRVSSDKGTQRVNKARTAVLLDRDGNFEAFGVNALRGYDNDILYELIFVSVS